MSNSETPSIPESPICVESIVATRVQTSLDELKLLSDDKQKQVSKDDSNSWNYQWDLASNTINHSNTKINITVVSPEVISTMMSKSVSFFNFFFKTALC